MGAMPATPSPATQSTGTPTVTRPPGPRGPRRPPGATAQRSLPVAGAAAALQSAGLGVLAVMVVVLVGWASAAGSEASATAAVKAALLVWLAGHRAALAFDGGAFALAPLGLTALPLALLHNAVLRTGRAAQLPDRRGVVVLSATATATYAVAAVAVALLARSGAVQPDPVSAFAGAGLVAGVATGTAAVRAANRWPALWHRTPALLRTALPAAAVAVAVLVGAGAAVTGALLAVRNEQAAAITRAVDAGAGGALLLGVGCLLYVPNAAVWAASVAVGPGFAAGTGTSVTVAGADLGAVPAVPLLAALPQQGGGGSAWLLIAVPVVAGVGAGFVVRRESARPAPPVRYPLTGWRTDLRAAGLTGLLTGAALALLTAFATGPAGPGRMADVGPDWWAVGLAAGAEVAAVAAVTLLALRILSRG